MVNLLYTFRKIFNEICMKIFKKLFCNHNIEEIPQTAPPETSLDGTRGDKIVAFKTTMNKSIEWSELKDVEFGMWLPCEQDLTFAHSEIISKWTRIYSLTRHYWSYISADLLKILDLVEGAPSRVWLPDTIQAFAYLTTDNEQVILSLSRGKGIRLHFAETTSFEYRQLYLNKFIGYCEAWSELVDIYNGEQDDDIGFTEWWEATISATKAVEEVKPVLGVGKIEK